MNLGDLYSECPRRHFQTSPSLLHSWTGSYPNACMPSREAVCTIFMMVFGMTTEKSIAKHICKTFKYAKLNKILTSRKVQEILKESEIPRSCFSLPIQNATY